jgi:mRNA interferase MazF
MGEPTEVPRRSPGRGPPYWKSHVYPFQVLLPAAERGMPRDSKAQAGQVRSVAVERVGPRLGRLSPSLLADLEDALRLHLAL